MRYQFEHEKRNFVSASNHVWFCLFYKPNHNEVFDDFPKISDHFPKIFKMLSSGHTNVSEHIPKIAEENPKMFRHNIDKRSRIQHQSTANSSANVTKSISSRVKDMTSHVKV